LCTNAIYAPYQFFVFLEAALANDVAPFHLDVAGYPTSVRRGYLDSPSNYRQEIRSAIRGALALASRLENEAT
jgi:hypothetical protein